MKRTALFIVLAVVMLLGLGSSASAYTPGSNEVMVFGPDENRNIFHPDYGVDHSYDEAIAQAFLNGETAPNYLLNGITSSAQFRMNYVKNTNPEFVSIANFNVWFNMNTGVATSAYIDLYTENSTRDWQKAQAEFALRSEEVFSELDGLIPEGATDAMIVHIVHDYLVANTVYDEVQIQKDESDADLYDAYGALVLHRTACQGYSLAYMYILDHYGINCAVAVSGVQQHAWNLVEIEEEKTDNYGVKYTEKNWYHVDLSADDPFYDTLGQVSHKYLLLSTAELLAISPGRADFDVYSRNYNLVFTDNTCANAPFEGRAESIWATSNSACYYYRNADGGIDLYCLDSSNALHKNSGEGHYPPGENMTWVSFGSAYFYQVSRLSADFSGGKHILYYTAPTKIYSIDLDNQADDEPSMSLFYDAGAFNDPGLIFGLARVEGVLYYTYSTIPAAGNETWIPVPSEDTPSEKAVSSLFLAGGKIYADAKHTKEVTVTGLSYSAEKGSYVLSGLNFSSTAPVGLWFEDSEVTLELQEGSENLIVLNGDNSGTKTGLFAPGKLTISGAGSLTAEVTGGSRRAFGIRATGDLCIRDGAEVTGCASTGDKDAMSFGIFQWKENSTAEFFNCRVSAKGQRAAVRFGKKVLSKTADNSDLILTGSTEYSAEAQTLTACVFGSMPIGSTTKESVIVALQAGKVVKDFALVSSSSFAVAAEVDPEGKEVRRYDNLPEAAAVSSKQNRVRLLADYSMNSTLEISEAGYLNLDLCGYTLSDPGAGQGLEPLIINRGTLHISDSSEGHTGKVSSYMSGIVNWGTMSISDVAVEAYTILLRNEAGAEFTMYSGSMVPITGSTSLKTVDNYGRFVMVEGTLQNRGASVCNNEGAEFVMKGGTVSGNKRAASYAGAVINKGRFVMTGGTFTGNDYTIDTYTSDTYLLGGLITKGNYYGVKTLEGCETLTIGGDIRITGNSLRNLYLYSANGSSTRLKVSTEVPLEANALVGVKFSSITALTEFPYQLVVSGMTPERREVIRLEDDLFSSKRLRYSEGGLFMSDETDVLIHLTSDCGGASVALLSGGGVYSAGGTAVLKAEPLEGYTFEGWYDGETFLGDTVSLTLTNLSEDVFAVARYSVTAGMKVSVTLKKGDYTVKLPGSTIFVSCSEDMVYSFDPLAEITVRYRGGDKFEGWKDRNGVTLSTLRTFTFRVLRGLEVSLKLGE